jgi:hypothetical protein
MKKIAQSLLFASLLFSFASCDKVDALKVFGEGNAPVLSASAATIAPTSADSNNVVLTLNWTYPNHSTDTSNIKYVVEIDSVGKNFAAPYTKVEMGKLSTTFIAKELNSFLLARGYAFNVPVDMQIRLTSSYANNNERIASNIVVVKMTPYKVPPRVALPTTGKLYIVGAATQGGWNNPVPTPSQELARLNETTWAGIFQMNGGEQYLLLPLNGDWGNKFSVANNQLAGLSAGGDFGFNLNDNFPAPSNSGWYKIIVDFQTGKFKVTPYTSTLPNNLYMVGGATPGGWNNPVPVPSQQFTRLNASQWELTIALTAGEKYLLLPNNGSWDNKYGVPDNAVTGLGNGGEIKYNDNAQDIPAPSVSGNYKVLVNFATTENFATGKFSAVRL